MKELVRKSGHLSAALKWISLLGFIMCWGLPETQAADRQKFTYVVVPGAFGGGWDWKTVDALLTARGHKVYRPTLTGLGEKAHLATPTVNLTTHIKDIVNLIRYESLSNVVLVGHSYGGMVITGVMDEIPERLKQVIFLDAAIPNNGESFITYWQNLGFPSVEKETPTNGYAAPSFINFNKPPPSEVPQSLKTFSEPVSFRNPAAKLLPATCVFFFQKNGKPEERRPADFVDSPLYRRVNQRGWKSEELDSDHLAERTHPKELVALLIKIPGDRTKNSP